MWSSVVAKPNSILTNRRHPKYCSNTKGDQMKRGIRREYFAHRWFPSTAIPFEIFSKRQLRDESWTNGIFVCFIYRRKFSVISGIKQHLGNYKRLNLRQPQNLVCLCLNKLILKLLSLISISSLVGKRKWHERQVTSNDFYFSWCFSQRVVKCAKPVLLFEVISCTFPKLRSLNHCLFFFQRESAGDGTSRPLGMKHQQRRSLLVGIRLR